MSNNLIIVESPTKSKTITKFLRGGYTVKASMGHLRDLKKSTLSVDVEHDFQPEYINIRGKGDLIRELKAAAAKADKVYLATDPDREGEAISWHLAHILGINEKELCRIAFHEITSSAVKEALKHPRTIDMDMVDAQQTRRIIDRLVGYEADVVKKDGAKLELHTAAETVAVENDLQQAAYSVVNAVKKPVTRRPPAPFTTSTLQQEAAHRLNFTTRRTMLVAQQLYEGVSIGRTSVGLITYMRTDSTRLAAEALTSIREFVSQLFGGEYCPAKPNFFSNKNNAQDAHEAIRPTSITRTPSEVEKYLTKEQYRLYKLIWDRTMACQMAPAKYDQTTLQIAAGNYELKASGSVMTFDGFMRLADKKDMKKEGSGPVPYIEPGRSLVLHKVEHGVQHFTEPPASYTEASLVKKMEEEGIGRPSTYAPIIQTIQSRGYVVKDGKKLVATDLGKKVVDLLTTYFGSIINIPYSAAMETELDEIAEHKEDKLTVLRNFYGPFEALLEKADKVIPKDPPPLEKSGVICEKCGREMVIREGRYGKFLACPGFPECRNTKPLLEKIGVSCPQCGGDITVRHTRTNKVFYGCSNYPECKFTSWDKPTNETCPKCGHMLLEHAARGGKVRRVCSNPDCEDALSKRPSRKKTTTADLLKVKKVVKGRETRKTAAKKTSARKTASAATKSKAARK